MPGIIQIALLATSDRRPVGLGFGIEYAIVALVLVAAVLLGRVPARVRTGFLLVGLTILLVGQVSIGGGFGAYRYLTVAWAGAYLVMLSAAAGVGRAARRRARDRGAANRAAGDPAAGR